MNRFDNVVGIGYNCEISFRIRNYFGKLDAQLFSWSYIYDRDLFLDAFVNPDKIYSGDMILKDNGMFECAVTKISFHPRHEVLDDKSRDREERIQWCKEELKERVQYLKEKHLDLLKSEKNTLFLLKVRPVEMNEDLSFVKAIYDLLRECYQSGKFMLVVLVPGKKYKKELMCLEGEKLQVRALRWFSPQKHTDIASDSRGWANVFNEFCEDHKKEFYKRERKQRQEIIPGMIRYKIRTILKRV